MSYHVRLFYEEEETWNRKRALETDYPNAKVLMNVAEIILEWGDDNLWGIDGEYANTEITFDSLEDFFMQYVPGTKEVHFDENGDLHKEDGPALNVGMMGYVDELYWFWHGKHGIENFPDDALAKLGDLVI